jgi:hypothetical protein
VGKGYTGIMADVLNYAADNPKILSTASGQRLPDNQARAKRAGLYPSGTRPRKTRKLTKKEKSSFLPPAPFFPKFPFRASLILRQRREISREFFF